MRSRRTKGIGRRESTDGEFLWLISLSDLMMLLFVFFVVLFSFASQKLSNDDFYRIKNAFSSEAKPGTPMDTIQAELLKWVTDRKLLDAVQVVRKNDALILEIKEKLLFESGQAQLKDQALEILPYLKEALAKIPSPYRLGIEGHTDDQPLAGHSDNWQLSVSRALNVQRALQLAPDLESRVVIMGFGPNRPLVPNRNSSGQAIVGNQAQNRRVTIRIF